MTGNVEEGIAKGVAVTVNAAHSKAVAVVMETAAKPRPATKKHHPPKASASQSRRMLKRST
jgi:hypothetical protein